MAGMGMIPILLCGRLAGRPWQLTSSLRASGLSAVQWARCSPCTTPHSGCSHSGCPAHLWWARPLPPARPCPDLPFDGHTFPSSLAPHTPLLPLSPSPGPSAPWLAEAPRMSLTAAFLGLDCVCPVTHPSTWSQGLKLAFSNISWACLTPVQDYYPRSGLVYYLPCFPWASASVSIT